MPKIGTVGKRACRRVRVSRHSNLLSSKRPLSAHRAERRLARRLWTGGLLPFPRTGCVLVRNADRNPIDPSSQSPGAVLRAEYLHAARLTLILKLFAEDVWRLIYVRS